MSKELIRNVIYGVAVGDAVGNRLEFNRSPSRRDVQKEIAAKQLRISDDTQMTLFLMEQCHKMGVYPPDVRLAYKRWYQTQQGAVMESRGHGLLDFPELYSREAPGATCLSSCFSMFTVGRMVENDSKGNGTVMRASPIALRLVSGEWGLNHTVIAAKMDAQTTHKHPFAWMASVFLCLVYGHAAILRDIPKAFQEAKADAPAFGLTLEFLEALQDAYEAPRAFGGWVAEEALGMALRFASENRPFLATVRDAVHIGGDSDTVGSIAGGLAALVTTVPEKMIAKIVAKDAIDYALSVYLA